MRVAGVLLDVDGVLVLSWEPIPGAIAALRAVRAAGLRVAFLTNTTSRTRAQIGASLREAGFWVHDDELLTAGVATAAYLAQEHPGARCLVLNEGPLDDLAGVRLAEPSETPDVVVIGSAGPGFTWAALNRAARAVSQGAALVAMHGTGSWNTKDGLCVDGGAYVAALERATGCQTTTVGKPASPMFQDALARVQLPPSAVVMVGDDLANDVQAAQALGLHGILVRTGKFRPAALRSSGPPPDLVLDSIADLPASLGLT